MKNQEKEPEKKTERVTICLLKIVCFLPSRRYSTTMIYTLIQKFPSDLSASVTISPPQELKNGLLVQQIKHTKKES